MNDEKFPQAQESETELRARLAYLEAELERHQGHLEAAAESFYNYSTASLGMRAEIAAIQEKLGIETEGVIYRDGFPDFPQKLPDNLKHLKGLSAILELSLESAVEEVGQLQEFKNDVDSKIADVEGRRPSTG